MFSKELSDLSSEPEASTRYLALLTEIFQTILSQIVRNWLFHTFNYLVFDGQYSAEEIRNEICAFW